MSMDGIIIINKGGNDLQLQIQSNHLSITSETFVMY